MSNLKHSDLILTIITVGLLMAAIAIHNLDSRLMKIEHNMNAPVYLDVIHEPRD